MEFSLSIASKKTQHINGSSPSRTKAPGTVLIDGVSKRFAKASRKKTYSTVKSSFLKRWISKPDYEPNYLQALDDVSVLVEPGCSLGVVGRNGSGKSTLLKLIAGIYRPDKGKVEVSGRVSALIELGAGFHPDFSGRENIYLAGVMYGMPRKKIDERFNDIVRYAELEDFIDDPVRTYSSGMYMRLGFSVAIHTDPDVLLVDEVLAVGDAAFVNRCKDTISDFRRQGKTLIFVTHDLSSIIRWCDDALWLNKGVVRKRGNPQWVIDSYLGAVAEGEEKHLQEDNERLAEAVGPSDAGDFKDVGAVESVEQDTNRWGSREVEITDVKMLDAQGASRWVWNSEDAVIIELDYFIKERVSELVFGVGILGSDGQVLHGTNTDIERKIIELPANQDNGISKTYKGVVRYNIKRLGLVDGTYYLDVAAHRRDGSPFDYHHRMYKFSVRCDKAHHGVWFPDHTWEIVTDYEEQS